MGAVRGRALSARRAQRSRGTERPVSLPLVRKEVEKDVPGADFMKKRVFQRAVSFTMKLNPRAVTKVAMPAQPAADGSSSNEPARRAGAMRPSLLAVDLLRSLLARI